MMSDTALLEGPVQRDEGSLVQALLLVLGGSTFAVETDRVLEVLDDILLVTVPNCQPHVRGLINMRGKVVPVVDLQILLGALRQKRHGDAQDRRIIVLTLPLTDGDTAMVGVLADKVHQVIPLDQKTTETIPSIGMDWDSTCIKYISKHNGDFIIALDVDKIFTPLLT